MAKIQHERLIKLGQIMRSVSPGKVNMDMIIDVPENIITKSIDNKKNKHACGTVGCALGQITMNDYFRNLGVSFYNTGHGQGVKYKNKYYGSYAFAQAGAAIFGITEDEADGLFGPAWREGTTDKEVFLKRFRAFMKSKNLHM